MCTSYAMMASSVTPPVEEEGVEVDGAVEAGGVAVSVQVASSKAIQDFA